MNLWKQTKRQQRKVGREEEGSSSNRPELAAFVLALRGTHATKPMLHLCDNQALLKAVKRWVGEGEKATLVGAPDADILLEAIEELRKRTTAGGGGILQKLQILRFATHPNSNTNANAFKILYLMQPTTGVID